jgi:hypothetical protein
VDAWVTILNSNVIPASAYLLNSDANDVVNVLVQSLYVFATYGATCLYTMVIGSSEHD